MSEHLDRHNEGKATFKVGEAFYNPQSKLVRDLGILAAIAYKQERGSLRVLDALGGCGVRSLRYWLEAEADYVWVNEGNLELKELLQQNLAKAIASNCCQVTNLDAHHVFFDCYQRRDYYDFVDVDCFGSAAPYLSTMLWATKIDGLMYLTATDGRTLTGNLALNSIQSYAAIARSHPAAHEQALRLLIGSVQQQAATLDLGVEPIFSWFTGTNYRLLLRLTAKPQLTDLNYGFLAYCHYCGNYRSSSWRKIGQIGCKCDRPNITVSGAMWLGRLHHPQELTKLIAIAQKLNWHKAIDILSLMLAELNSPPYFYTLREIGKRGQLNLPKRSHLIAALQDAGYQSSITHVNLQAIKTNADLDTCIEIARIC
jgi:tRNA (guanine26-N2/guanine27-N2)-dimethyltransferase